MLVAGRVLSLRRGHVSQATQRKPLACNRCSQLAIINLQRGPVFSMADRAERRTLARKLSERRLLEKLLSCAKRLA